MGWRVCIDFGQGISMPLTIRHDSLKRLITLEWQLIYFSEAIKSEFHFETIHLQSGKKQVYMKNIENKFISVLVLVVYRLTAFFKWNETEPNETSLVIADSFDVSPIHNTLIYLGRNNEGWVLSTIGHQCYPRCTLPVNANFLMSAPSLLTFNFWKYQY